VRSSCSSPTRSWAWRPTDGPRLLSTAVDQFGNPIAVWQRTAWDLVPEKEAPVLHTV
jgi:hypothetical protein